VEAKRQDAKAATTIQNKQRGKLAKKKVEAKRQDAKAATVIQNKHRQKQAKERVGAMQAGRSNEVRSRKRRLGAVVWWVFHSFTVTWVYNWFTIVSLTVMNCYRWILNCTCS
jgi:hypothetical protein